MESTLEDFQKALETNKLDRKVWVAKIKEYQKFLTGNRKARKDLEKIIRRLKKK